MPPWASSAQAMRAILLASATATTLKGRRAKNCREPGILLRVLLGASQDGMRADDKNPPLVAVTLLARFSAFDGREDCPSGRIQRLTFIKSAQVSDKILKVCLRS